VLPKSYTIFDECLFHTQNVENNKNGVTVTFSAINSKFLEPKTVKDLNQTFLVLTTNLIEYFFFISVFAL
jgi:hypothetical protein